MDWKRIQSSSSSQMMWEYDVFVSFRGEDTRNYFSDHLLSTLHKKGFIVFRDDIKLKKGENISTELLQAIERSQVLIVVFSKSYASSTWCLQELEKIADCIEVQGQTVLPIFYDVNPSEVRKQSGNYGKAFVNHEEKFKEELEKVRRWREALTQVADLCGWDIRDKPQYAEIGKIIQEVTCILGHKFSTLPEDIVGMHSRVKELEKLLLLDSDDVRVVGICGMGGIGKTTLATTLYDKISNQFDASCFIDNVSKVYADYGSIGAQKQLLCQIMNEENLRIWNISKANSLIRTRLCQTKALIILDNVDQVEQLDKLGMKREWLGAGSKIVITSRDEHILKEYKVDELYKVQLLDYYDSYQLFCRKAFKGDDIMRDYIKLIDDVLAYANGLPLAIKVIGSFLFGRDVPEWRSALVRLRESSRKDIMDVLRISFDALENTEKEIFLDIACCLYGTKKEYLNEVLNFRGFFPEIGLGVLIDKSLLTCDWGIIHMHDLLRELGKSIVQEKSPTEPRKWSRLWSHKDLHNVMVENMEAENIEVITMKRNLDKLPQTTMRADGLSKMSNLKLLELRDVDFLGNLNFISNELGYLTWERYPFTCLPSSFQPDKLVDLILAHSNIKQLWKGIKRLHHLKRMDLSHSRNLTKVPDFREIPNLEWLNLEGCVKLVQIDSSIGILRKLAHLDLKNCKNLASIPNNIFYLISLSYLNLSGCSKLFSSQKFGSPRHMKHLEIVEINESGIQQQSTSSIEKILKSSFLCFYPERHEESVVMLLPSLPRFLCLQDLDLSFCNLLQVPDAIGWLHSLMRLNLGGNNFTTLPSSIKELSKLLEFNLEHCKQLKYLPELPVRSKASLDHYRGGLYIFNSPNLIEIEQCYTMVFSWMIQLLQVHMQSSLHYGRIGIVIPGTEIPRWFNKQKAGSSISMDLTPHMLDENCIGVACCATLVAHDDPTNLSYASNIGEEWPFHVMFLFQFMQHLLAHNIPLHIREDLVTLESNHLLLFFLTRESFLYYYTNFTPKGAHDIDSIKLEISIHQPQGVHMEVENCGYHWLFKEDLEKFNNPEMMYSRNSPVGNRMFLTNG